MAQRPTVRWNEAAGRWMAWVRFPDGSRRKVERVVKADAQRDLDDLVALRAESGVRGPLRQRLAAFDEVIDGWLAAGCPSASSTRSRHAREKSPSTIENARQLLGTHVPPGGGSAVGGAHRYRSSRVVVRGHGRERVRHEHRRPDLLYLTRPVRGLCVRGGSRPTRASTFCSQPLGRRRHASRSRSSRLSGCSLTQSRMTGGQRCGSPD